MRLIDTTAVIAGGAPRDWSFNKEAADIDLFYYVDKDLSFYEVDTLLTKVLGLELELVNHSPLYEGNKQIRSVRNTQIDGVKIQLVQLYSPDARQCIENFPLNMCKFFYDLRGVHIHRDAEVGMRHKVLVKLVEDYRNQPYIDKIKEKFPDYTFWNSYQELTDAWLDGKIK